MIPTLYALPFETGLQAEVNFGSGGMSEAITERAKQEKFESPVGVENSGPTQLKLEMSSPGPEKNAGPAADSSLEMEICSCVDPGEPKEQALNTIELSKRAMDRKFIREF